MQNTQVRCARPLSHLSVAQPANNMPTIPAISNIATSHPACDIADALRLAQQRRSPVEHRETDDIYEEIGEAQDPDQRVPEDVLHQECAGARRPSSRFSPPSPRCLPVREAPPKSAYRAGRRPARWLRRMRWPKEPRNTISTRRHAQRRPSPAPSRRHRRGPRPGWRRWTPRRRVGRHVHAHGPHDIAAEDHHEARTDRVRGIPHRHLGRQLRGRNPVGQQTRAGRESRPCNRPFTTHMIPMKRIIVLVNCEPSCCPVIQ